jgi:mRNA interferase RelE/StbE
MNRVVRVSEQVVRFSTNLAPEPRRMVKQALRDLRAERGDIRVLEGVLAGYHRLRAGRFRIIFSYAADGAIEVLFMEERSLVYEVFEAEFIRRLKS